MKKLKKLAAVLIALAMCTSLLSFPAAAADVVATIGETEYTSISDAFTAAQDGDTIVLQSDFSYGGSYVKVNGVSITLDLNGCTWTNSKKACAIWIYADSELTIIDSSEAGTGNFCCESSSCYNTVGQIAVYGTLNLEGGTIKGLIGTTQQVSRPGVKVCSGGTFNMSGGTITEAYMGVYIYGGSFNMTGGTITGCAASGSGISYGGGIWLGYNGVATIDGGAVYNNTAALGGSDIYCYSGTLYLIGSASGTLDCGDAVTGWYTDDPDNRWSCDNITELATSESQYIIAAHGDGSELEPAIEKVSESSIEKTADCETASTGDVVTYTLTSNISETMGDAITYTYVDGEAVGTCGEYTLTFHDTMDDGLTIDTASITVTVAGTEIDAKYITTSTNDDCTIDIIVDLAALYNDGIITEADMGIASVVVTYTAAVDGDVIGALKNTATVSYEDATSEASTAVVKVYALSIFKYDYADVENGLSGAEFELTNAEGTVIATVTTDTDGYATITGLAAGEYTLTETQAPDGYVCSDESYTITIDGDGEYTVVYAVANAAIPSTGGMGTAMYTVGGMSILLAAAVLYLLSSRKKAY